MLIHFLKNNCGPKEPYCLTAIYNCTLQQKQVGEKYMGLYTPRQMMNDPVHGHISYNSSLSYPFKLKLVHNLKQSLVQMKAAKGKDKVEHVIRPAKVIPTTLLRLEKPTANLHT